MALPVIRPLPECGARRSHGSESDGGGRWLEGFGCGVNGLADGYGSSSKHRQKRDADS